MKKIVIILMIGAIILFSTGCTSSDVKPAAKKAYPVAKAIYKVGASVVKSNSDLIDDETLDTLKRVDKVAKTIDGIKSSVEGQ